MKKALYIIVLGLLGLVGFTRASVNSMSLAPAMQSAISGSLVTFTVTGTNGSGDAYLKYVLPKTAAYDIVYQNASLTPANNALLSLGAEHDPVFLISANSSFSVTITAKVTTNTRAFSTIDTNAIIATDSTFANVMTSALAQISPIADLAVTNILTGANPSFSGDVVSYYITLQNIGSATATGVSFISTFPIPTLSTPTATFNGSPYIYDYINYPQDFVWSGSYFNVLTPGQTTTILLNAFMTQAFAIGTPFNQIAKAMTTSTEYSTTNNSATATGIVQAPADVWITKTLTPFTGYNVGDKVIYTIAYGNSGGKVATNVNITDIVPAGINIPVNTFTIGTLPAGSGGVIILTGTLTNLFTSGQVFVNTADITTNSIEGSTGNNSSTATGVVQGIATVTLDIIANNLTRSQYDNAPYGSGPNVMIQAVSGDIIQLTITYANRGNATGANATISLGGIQGFTTLGTFNGTIGTLQLNTTGTIVITGIVGPQNYISFSPSARLTYNANLLITDSVTIQEPLVCGDGLLTRNELCDTQGNLGVLYSGQVCENQQGICVLRTNSIINNACVNYQYTDPIKGIITGQACSSVNLALTNASCASMAGSAPTVSGSGYNVSLACKGNNTTATTPISIDCGNGTIVSGIGASFNGTCTYASTFVGNAQCRVGNDVNNSACRTPISITAGQCKSLEARDGTVAIVDDNNRAESRFRCTTIDGTLAQKMTIDCGNDTQYVANNVSVLETGCVYKDVDVAKTFTVKCLVDDVITPACQQKLVVDKGIFGRCGDDKRQGYEKCDGTDTPDGMTCTENCDIEGATMVGCFNVGNTNLSVQEDEILPFWRTLDDANFSSTCDTKDEGKIKPSSLYCDFSIHNGDNRDNSISLGSLRCDTDTRKKSNGQDYTIFNYLNTLGKDRWSLQNAFGKYSTIVDRDITKRRYGEYQLVLDEVKYDYCNGKEFVSGTPIKRVCEVNFAVTKPYLIQKSSFGLTPKTTDNVDIDNFYDLNNVPLVTSTEMNKIMVVDGDTYNGTNKTQTMIDDFITKYDKLAITVPEKSLKDTVFAKMGVTVKIVPQQKIYILQSNTKKTIILQDVNNFKAPFTIVTKGVDIVIKGDVNYNGMFLVKEGTIAFEKADGIIGGDRCSKVQTVKGIFVTDQGFVGGDKLANTNRDESRCNYGGLYVKGILIGNNIDNVVQARRSQLNHWFMVGGTSEAGIKAERRNEIFNGASVLIEYSPSLRTTLPPGASDFTKALDIYKQ